MHSLLRFFYVLRIVIIYRIDRIGLPWYRCFLFGLLFVLRLHNISTATKPVLNAWLIRLLLWALFLLSLPKLFQHGLISYPTTFLKALLVYRIKFLLVLSLRFRVC